MQGAKAGARAVALAAAVAASAALAPLPARAQHTQALPSPESNCITPALEDRRPAEYPEERLRRKDGAYFFLELSFAGPDTPPGTRLVRPPSPFSHPPIEEDFVQAAERYASQLRAPCAQEGRPPVRLRQAFHFVPNDGRRVTVSAPADLGSEAYARVENCLKPHRGNTLGPEYPRNALSGERQGSVIVQATFESADQPPLVQLVAEPFPGSDFGEAVLKALKNLRAPCMEGPPVTYRQVFVFRLADGQRTVLRDMNLRQMVGALAAFPSPAYFDTRALGCPFDLRMTYYAPHMNNAIAEVGDAVPARLPFLQWLQKVQLNLPRNAGNLVLGDTFTLHVPCVQLDLQP